METCARHVLARPPPYLELAVPVLRVRRVRTYTPSATIWTFLALDPLLHNTFELGPIVANAFHFTKAEFFELDEADAAARRPVEVDFD